MAANAFLVVWLADEYRGTPENQKRAMNRLRLIVPLVLFAIMGLVYTSFGNGRRALLVMLNISTSPGAEVQRPLATVVIGGLLSSTFLTLHVLPVLYEWLEERWPAWAAAYHHQVKRRRHRRKRHTSPTHEPAGVGD